MPNKLILAAVAAALSVTLQACGHAGAKEAAALTGGDAARGRFYIDKYGCGACHTIGGISSAHGLVGPPLTGIVSRNYLGGVLPNTPKDIVAWIRNPHLFNPKTAMPALGVSQQDAADIAAYLYSTK